MTRLILVRHGHTASNGASSDPRMSGWTDLPLSSIGRDQVEALRARLKSEPPFTAVYSSPLQRARDTALRAIGCSADHLGLIDELREIYCGQVDGLSVSEVKRLHPDLWERNLRQEDAGFRWPGGESYSELRRRSMEALLRIASAHPLRRVVVVTHAGVISQVIGAIHGISPACWECYRPENASLTELEWSDSDLKLISFNDCQHLV